ncbi:MAG: carboxypeptidase regulatory-like domain-containing protein [Planctomycetota bacterium]
MVYSLGNIPVVSDTIAIQEAEDELVRYLMVGTLCFAAVAGCGSGDMGYVSGTVTMDGKPLPNAIVEFFPKPSGGLSAGMTDEKGVYELYIGRSGKGAKVGEHLVQISTADGGADDGDYGGASKELVPAKYNVNSELTATVKSGNNTIDFTLDSEGEIIDTPENY